jgi:hypothetical protein
LRHPPLSAVPSDFAARVAAESRAASELVEVWLERGLIALLLVAGGVALCAYNGESFQMLSFTCRSARRSAFERSLAGA